MSLTDEDFRTMHIGRHWPPSYRAGGARTIEDDCPCPIEPCGHIQHDKIHPNCPQHAMSAGKTIRSNHLAKHCPGEKSPS
jgi:hypothetical protein